MKSRTTSLSKSRRWATRILSRTFSSMPSSIREALERLQHLAGGAQARGDAALHEALELVERAGVLPREEEVSDRLLLVVRDRGEIPRLVAGVGPLRERIRGPVLQVHEELAPRAARRGGQRARIHLLQVTEEARGLGLRLARVQPRAAI